MQTAIKNETTPTPLKPLDLYTPTPTPYAVISAGTPLPERIPITENNVDKIIPLAHWGKGEGPEQVGYSPDGNTIAIGTAVGIYLYNAKSFEQVRLIGNKRATNFTFSPDGSMIASSWCGDERNSGEGKCEDYLWKLSDGSLLFSLEGGSADGLSFSPDGKMIAGVTSGNIMVIWSALDGKLIRKIEEGRHDIDYIFQVIFSADSQALIYRLGLTIYSLRISDETVISYDWKTRDVFDYSNDGKYLASVNASGSGLQIWNTYGAPVHFFPDNVNNSGKFTAHVKFSPDGSIIATIQDDLVTFYKIPEGTIVQQIKNFNSGKNSLFDTTSPDFSPDGKYLITGSLGDFTARIWRVTDGALVHTFDGFYDIPWGLEFSPDGTILAAAVERGPGEVRLWNSQNGTIIQTLGEDIGSYPIRNHLGFSPDGNLIADIARLQELEVWQLPSAKLLYSVSQAPGSGAIPLLSYSPDGMFIAISFVSLDSAYNPISAIHLLNPSDGETVAVYSDQTKGITDLSFSQDGKLLASASQDDGTIIVRQIPDGKVLYTIRAVSQCLAFSSDGNFLVAATSDGLQVRKASDGTLIQTLAEYNIGTTFTFSHAGNLLAVLGPSIIDNSPIEILQVPDGKLLGSMTLDSALWVEDMVFSPDDTLLAAGLHDGTIWLLGILK
jgi:WD40 repeat protein